MKMIRRPAIVTSIRVRVPVVQTDGQPTVAIGGWLRYTSGQSHGDHNVHVGNPHLDVPCFSGRVFSNGYAVYSDADDNPKVEQHLEGLQLRPTSRNGQPPALLQAGERKRLAHQHRTHPRSKEHRPRRSEE